MIFRFKARVEDKKNKIKNWLRETLRSPAFLELAKKKLTQAGFSADTRRTLSFYNATHIQLVQVETNSTNLDDRAMDEINLSNQINERIIEADEENNEAEKLLRTLALQEIMLSKKGNNSSKPALRTPVDDEFSIESLISFVTEE